MLEWNTNEETQQDLHQVLAPQYIYVFTSLPKDIQPALLHFAHLTNEEPENLLLTLLIYLIWWENVEISE